MNIWEANNMTRMEFYDACTTATISPFLALENEKIKAALKERDDKKVKELLETEF